MRTSFKEKEHEIGTQKKTVNCQELIEVESKKPEQESLSGESDLEESGCVDGQDQADKFLSVEFRWMSRSCTPESAVETCSTTDSSVDNTSRKSENDWTGTQARDQNCQSWQSTYCWWRLEQVIAIATRFRVRRSVLSRRMTCR